MKTQLHVLQTQLNLCSNTAHGINSAVGTRICTYASNLFSEKIIEIVFRNKVYFSVLFIIAQHRYTAEIMYCAL